MTTMPTRRAFLSQTALASASIPLVGPMISSAEQSAGSGTGPGFIDLRLPPASVAVQTDSGLQPLTRQGSNRWTGSDS